MAAKKDQANQRVLVRALLDGQHFAHTMQPVRLIQTHISWVLLAGRYAYKIKKALNLGFLDFVSLKARRFYCAEELRLNRRMARGLYLDVVPIGGSFDAPIVGRLPAIEYAVRMRRFAAANEFDHLLECGELTPQHMDSLAALLAAFHDSLPPPGAESEFGTPAAIRAAAMQNFAQLQSLLTQQSERPAVDAVRVASESAYSACEHSFAERREQGFVRECHGDLHLGNIVLIGGQPVPFDGIEFNPDLRWIDVMDEVAFPVMDLLHKKRPDLAWRFLNAYLEASGDYAGLSVLRFYLAYRAMVRAKVSAIRAFQPTRARAGGLAACQSYVALAGACLAAPNPALIITHGLPGSGKSTFARVTAEKFAAIRIRSDVERKRLFGLKPLDDSRALGDIYSAEATQRTYARLAQLARGALAAGFSVIVDAAFLKQDEREPFCGLAREMALPFVIASRESDSATLRQRISQRQNDASEADAAVLHRLQAAQQALTEQELQRAVIFGDIHTDTAGWARLQDLMCDRRDGSFFCYGCRSLE
jgi:aminoglycoside phosphotransferase family enzyme/predicted kinase